MNKEQVVLKLPEWNVIEVDTNNDIWVEITVQIKNVETKEIVELRDKLYVYDAENCPTPYWWEEGNGSCDCNRSLYFERAKGNSPVVSKALCSEGRYLVNLINPKNNEKYYIEF